MGDKSTGTQLVAERPGSGIRLFEPEMLLERIDELHKKIARRAFELFERDGIFDRDLQHWFRAEAELLHPVHVCVMESENALKIQAEVPGFDAKEIQVSLEPQRLTIVGKRTNGGKKDQVVYSDSCSSEILRVVGLPAQVDATKTTAILTNGMLELNMPKSTEASRAHMEVQAP